MNIMLATVTERTREIGIRKSLGATRRDILIQFLVESAMLSGLGGLIGLLLAITVMTIVGKFAPVPVAIPLWAPVIAITYRLWSESFSDYTRRGARQVSTRSSRSERIKRISCTFKR